MLSQFAETFPGLYDALKIVDFGASTLIGTVKLLFFLMVFPFLFVVWCFYHPALTRVYATNALSLFMMNWATRACLGVMILFGMLAFKRTHTFAKRCLQTLMVAGTLGYIYKIF